MIYRWFLNDLTYNMVTYSNNYFGKIRTYVTKYLKFPFWLSILMTIFLFFLFSTISRIKRPQKLLGKPTTASFSQSHCRLDWPWKWSIRPNLWCSSTTNHWTCGARWFRLVSPDDLWRFRLCRLPQCGSWCFRLFIELSWYWSGLRLYVRLTFQ